MSSCWPEACWAWRYAAPRGSYHIGGRRGLRSRHLKSCRRPFAPHHRRMTGIWRGQKAVSYTHLGFLDAATVTEPSAWEGLHLDRAGHAALGKAAAAVLREMLG